MAAGLPATVSRPYKPFSKSLPVGSLRNDYQTSLPALVYPVMLRIKRKLISLSVKPSMMSLLPASPAWPSLA